MTGVRIEVTDREAAQGLGRIAAAGGDLRPTLRAIGARLVANTLQRFEDQRGPDGVPWKRSRRAVQQNGQTLVDTGRLRTSITFRAADASVEVGTNVVYAAIHQFGGTIRPKKGKFLKFRVPGGGFRQVRSVTLPARPFIGFSAEDREDVADIVARHLRAALNSAPRT